jgi:hypothetical protein
MILAVQKRRIGRGAVLAVLGNRANNLIAEKKDLSRADPAYPSLRRRLKLGIAGAVGAPGVPTPCDPASTARMSVFALSDCTT